jgi:hypothetical protein
LNVPVRVEVYSGEETTEIFIEMVFETLPGRISEKTGRHGCQQAHMPALTRLRVAVLQCWGGEGVPVPASACERPDTNRAGRSSPRQQQRDGHDRSQGAKRGSQHDPPNSARVGNPVEGHGRSPGGSAAKIRMLALEGVHVEPAPPAEQSFRVLGRQYLRGSRSRDRRAILASQSASPVTLGTGDEKSRLSRG